MVERLKKITEIEKEGMLLGATSQKEFFGSIVEVNEINLERESQK